MKVLLLIIGTIALVSGVKFIYDARPIVKKYFSFGDKNEATLGLKILGFLLVIIGRNNNIFYLLENLYSLKK